MSEQTRITSRNEDYPRWYLDVIAAARLASYSDVPGCMIIEPNGWALWERVTEIFDARIKATGHRNVRYPALIPLSLLQRETEHVEGFAPEFVTIYSLNGTKLEDPLVLRPTSETIMYADFAKKVASRSDLPIRINQWCNVWRAERRTLPFLRTFEFFWQEGHTAHATEAEARTETLDMLREYRQFAEGTLAIPCIPGLKSPGERFAGAVDTYSIETMMQNGKALQSATSHYLGQNFARAFGIKYAYGTGQFEFAYQTSWGMSTRIIGALIMSHSDDKGLVLPPRIAPVQAAILLIVDSKTSADEELRNGFLDAVRHQLDHAGVTSVLDATDRKLGLKQYDWEKQGIPLRIVVGASEIKQGNVTIIRRDTSTKMTVPLGGLGAAAKLLLDRMQSDLLVAAQERLRQKSRVCVTLDEIRSAFKEGNFFVHTGWAGTKEDEAGVKEAGDGVTLRCIPLEEGTMGRVEKCWLTGRPAKHQVILAKAY